MISENDTTKTMPDFIDIINHVHGFISIAEMELLYTLASQVPSGGNIVEIGSYQGRSTVCLGLGAKAAGALVYAIDPHDEYEVRGTKFGMWDNVALLKNLVDFGVADIVCVVTLSSDFVFRSWPPYKFTSLLWIDGSHDYNSVLNDLDWSHRVARDGKIALHDTAGYHPDVTRALSDFMARNDEWTICQKVDAITVMERFDNKQRINDKP